MPRITSLVSVAAFLLAVLTPALVTAYDRSFFYPKPPEAHVVPARDQAEAQRQDIAFLREHIDLDLAFTPGALAEARRRLDVLTADAGKLSPAGFHLAIARIIALAHNGHSRTIRGVLPDGKPYPRFPFMALPFSDGYCITRAMQAAADLLGACVIAVDGVPMATIAARFRDAYGTNDQLYPTELRVLLPLPDFLYAEHIAKRPGQAEITFKGKDGRTFTRLVKPIPGETFGSEWGSVPIMPKPATETDVRWDSLLHPSESLPLYLRHPGQWFVGELMADGKGYYLQLKLNSDAGGVSIRDFLAKAVADIRTMKPAYAVVDLRFNSGGDLTATTAMLASLPDLIAPDGRIYAITNGWTFSAAITNANVIKQTAGSRARIVGEPAGDSQRYWTEGGRTCLPNSKTCVQYTRGLQDYTRGCSGEYGCYYDELMAGMPEIGLIPLAVPSIAPDLPVSLSFADYAAGRDRAMEMVEAEENSRARK